LGRKEEAKRAVEILPVAKDALYGAVYVQTLAETYVTVGEYDSAVAKLERLLSIPSLLSVPLLRIDPHWQPLRDHPRFQRLMECG